MTYTTLQYEGDPRCRACGRTTWTSKSACCSCETACCDLCAVGILPNDELVCYRCARDWFRCDNCGSTRQSVRRDAELTADTQALPASDPPACCEADVPALPWDTSHV
jgi:hypothetical protein